MYSIRPSLLAIPYAIKMPAIMCPGILDWYKAINAREDGKLYFLPMKENENLGCSYDKNYGIIKRGKC